MQRTATVKQKNEGHEHTDLPLRGGLVATNRTKAGGGAGADGRRGGQAPVKTIARMPFRHLDTCKGKNMVSGNAGGTNHLMADLALNMKCGRSHT